MAEQTSDALLLVMRTYFEKPRTTVGWKGLDQRPAPRREPATSPTACALARRILLEVNELGVPCATEVLDPVTPQYLADLLSWAAIGARTTESQTHREMASGLSMPVGFKNGTDGQLATAVNAMVSAAHPHGFLGIDERGVTAVVRTRGNPDGHLVLRGGGGRPNGDARERGGRGAARRGPGHRAGRAGRLLPRQLGQGSGAPGGRLPRDRRAVARRPAAPSSA